MQKLHELNKILIEAVTFKDIIPLEYAWVILLFLIIFTTLLINVLMKYFINRLIKKLEKSKNIWDETALHVVRKPVRYFISFVGFLWAVQILSQYAGQDWTNALTHAWRTGVIVAIGWFLLRLIGALEIHFTDKNRKKSRTDEATVLAVGRLLKLTIMITMALIILQNFGFSISGVLAFGGIGGIAVGFAARDLLANFFGALMVFVDKPFRVGDWIRSPDREIEGTVEDIGWRITRIRTFDQRPLYVPNSIFASIAVENPSRMLNRRIYEHLNLRYDDLDKIETIVSQIKTLLKNHPDIEAVSRTLIVAFNCYGSHSVDIMVYTFTKTVVWVDYHEIKQKILLEIKEIIKSNGADFAFPTQQLYIQDNQDNQAEDAEGLPPDVKSHLSPL